MSTNTLNLNLEFSAREVLDAADYPGGSGDTDRGLRLNGFSTTQSLGSATTPAIEKTAVQIEVTLGGSPEIIDLTAVDIAIGRTEDMTGKKLIAYVMNAAAANTGPITVDAHSTNGYNLFGASGLMVFQPGRRLCSTVYGVSSADVAVSSGVQNIRLSGTSGDIMQIGLAFGT